ncbi:IS3 family transposase [Streptomyces sp. NBC_01077]|uniref:IS3 family transposase n=1 Tax=Streptomyces sp. NBC_01077 TaxID=2903746 RepID=UPI00386FFB5E
MHAELRRLGRRANHKRIARVMRERDIRGVTRRKRRSLTRADKKARPFSGSAARPGSPAGCCRSGPSVHSPSADAARARQARR